MDRDDKMSTTEKSKDPNPTMHFTAKAQRPKLTIYKAADAPRYRFIPNRYGTATIGIAAQVGARVFSLTWARPVVIEPSAGGQGQGAHGQ